jgi:L-ascorbate metabolism protein UlaG (beta-lactamase superfamily)
MHALQVLLCTAIILSPVAARAEPTRPAPDAAGRTVIRKLARGNDIATVLVSRSGAVVALDPVDVVDGVQADLALVTHKLHADARTLGKSRVPMVVLHRLGPAAAGEVKVTAIAASHKGGPVDAAAPDHVLYRVDADGLVIALVGCLGQSSFTPEQLRALGEVDVALVTADRGGFELMDLVETSFALMTQLRPRIVVPLSHHADDEGALERLSELGKLETAPELALSRKDRGDGPMRVVNVVLP